MTPSDERHTGYAQAFDALAGEVAAERMRLAHAFLPGGIAGSFAGAATVVWLLSNVRATPLLVAWQAAIVLCIALLVGLLVAFRRAKDVPRKLRTWGTWYQGVVVLNGTAWGLLGPTLLREPQSLGSALFPVLAGAMCAGGACALAWSLPLFMAYTLPLIVGSMLTLALDPAQGLGVLVLVAVVYALSVLAAWRTSRAISDSSRLAIEKVREAADVAQMRADLERSRARLIEELASSKRIQAELHANELHFRALVETSGDIVWAVDAAGFFTYVNGSALEAILGYSAEEVIGFPFTQFADRATAQAFDEEFFKLTEGGGQLDVKGVFVHRSGHVRHLAIGAIAMRDVDGRFIGASGTAVDVSEIKAVETLLRQALAEQNAILNSATVGIAIVANGQITRANSEWEALFGYPFEGIEGLPIEDLYAGEDREAWLATVESAVTGRGVYDTDVVCLRRDGREFWCRLAVRSFDQEGTKGATIWVVQDISDRKQKEQTIEHAALHDALTGLPNRALLSDRLEQAIRHSSRVGTKFGVLFLDLDRFKMVNDTVGHDGGDELLRTVAERLRGLVRSTDTVARQGGDEFIIMLPEVRSVADVERIAESVLAEIARPITISGDDYVVTGSIGISIYPDHGADPQSLLRNADAAMYRSKEHGKNTCRVFSEELHVQATEDVRLENMLRAAIDLQQLTVHYQPRVDLATGRVSSLEALCRWNHATLGWIEPAKFIAIAERAGLIGRLGDWVLGRACRDLAQLSALGFDGLGLSVNVSHSQLSDPELAANVRRTLREFGLDPNRLELELTETAIARNVDQAVTSMESLEATGIGIAIDDFGTGYSSLSQLKRFPIRTLKIDRSFVAHLPQEADDVAIALAIIAMAKRLKMRVVAEGVETPEQRDFLLRHECDQAQGFLFSPAVPLVRIVDVLRAASGARAAIERPSRRVA
jgi:diguanylate cyclase (GGDEF)-like protein/PAS domain S-box-containing protein